MQDQNYLCHATQLTAKHMPRADTAKLTELKSVVIMAYTWHLESGRGLTGAEAFLASVQLRQEGKNGLKRRPRPFRKTLLERL